MSICSAASPKIAFLPGCLSSEAVCAAEISTTQCGTALLGCDRKLFLLPLIALLADLQFAFKSLNKTAHLTACAYN